MEQDELHVDPDNDLAKVAVRLSQLAWIGIFVAFAVALWIASWFSGQPFFSRFAPWTIVAFVYVMERQFFVGRMYELNERLKRIEHKVNSIMTSVSSSAP